MFIGHLALGMAAKRVTPRISLAVLLIAAQWADTIWPLFLAAGIEHVRIDPGNTAVTPLDFVSYPYSHSLLALIVWGFVVGVPYRLIAGGRRSVWVLSALVVSHWLLDFLTHRPDMPLYPGGPKYGLELWASRPWTMIVEIAMYAAGVWIYMTATRPRDAIGRWAFPALAVLLFVIYIANLFGGPPPSVEMIYTAGLGAATLLMLWAWWADRHRDAVAASRSAISNQQ
jgi:hypothetical protein